MIGRALPKGSAARRLGGDPTGRQLATAVLTGQLAHVDGAEATVPEHVAAEWETAHWVERVSTKS